MSTAAWSRLAQLLAVAVLAIVAGLSFSMALGLREALLPVVCGAMIAVFLSSVLHERWRPPISVSVLVSLVGLVLAVLVVARGNPTDAADGLIRGWKLLLTAGVPAPAEAPMLVVPLVVSWIAASVGAELTLRTANALAPLAPPVAAYVLGLMFGVDGSAARQGVLAVVGLLVLGGVLVMLRASYSVGGRRTGAAMNTSNRRVIAGLGIIATFVVVGTAAGVLLPFGSDREPFELRDVVREPSELRTALNPTAFVQKALNERQDDNSTPVFSVETTRDSEKARYRLVVLDSYDGNVWSSSGQFLRASNELPAPPDVTVPTETVSQRITIERLGGYWLPMVDWPSRVSDDDLVFDRSTGMLAASGALAPGRTIEIESREPMLAGHTEVPRTARFATGPEAEPYLRLPAQFTATLRAAATDGAKAQFQFQSATELEKYVSTERGLQTAPPDRPRSGQSLADLDNLLTATGGGIGSPDQFAALYAVLGRAVGMPTRLVVGYGVPPGAGRHEVRANDLQVWPEVLFEGIGWVGFDPVPGGQAKPDQRAPENKPDLADTLRDAGQPPSDPSAVGPVAQAVPAPVTNAALVVLGKGTLIVLATVAVLALWATILFLLRRARRQSRFGRPDPRARIVGAWEEALDHLAETGLQDSRALTATDVVRASLQRYGPDAGQPLGALRTLANQARYRLADPSSEQVGEAWDLSRQFADQARRSLSFAHRVRLLVDPRPLLARH